MKNHHKLFCFFAIMTCMRITFSTFWHSFQTDVVQHAQSFELGFIIIHWGSVACLSMIATSPSYFEFSCLFNEVSDIMLHFVLLASTSFVQHFHRLIQMIKVDGFCNLWWRWLVWLFNNLSLCWWFSFFQLFEDVLGIEEICLALHSYLVSDIPFLPPTEA